MKRFCVRCGRETSSLIQSLCVDCYLEKKKVIELPEKIKIDKDKHNGKIRLGRHWVEPLDEKLEEFLLEKITTKLKEKLLPLTRHKIEFTRHERSIDADAVFDTTIEGVNVTVKRKIVLELQNTISDASMKLSSNYHEAVIQARFAQGTTNAQAKEKLEEILILLFKYKKIDELSEAVDIKKVRGGIDLLIGSKKSARKVSEELAKKYKTKTTYSNKLLGMKDGQEYYRDYLCVRF